MRKLSLIFFVAAAMLCHAAYATSEEVDLTSGGRTQFGWQLKEWVGKLPDAELPNNPMHRPPHSALWEDGEIKSSLISLLGEEEYRRFAGGWGEFSPSVTLVQAVDDQIAFDAIKAHDGEDTGGIIYISTKDKNVRLCWRGFGDEWRAPDHPPRKLAKGYCAVNDYSDFSRIYREQKALEAK